MAETDTVLAARDPGETKRLLLELNDKLDNMLERYLELLHEYQQAQSDMQKSMSKGFLDLARANFHATNGIRYGQDRYDDRMKAWRFCHIETTSRASPDICFRVDETAHPETSHPLEKNPPPDKPNDNTPEPRQQPSPPPEDPDPPLPQTSSLSSEEKTGTSPRISSPSQKFRWFGILLPPQMREVMARFTSVVEDPVPRAVNAARGMRELEVEIGRCRKAMRRAEHADAS